MTEPVTPADALRRRLRDDPDAARALDALRRAAYGRAPADAPAVEVPEGVRRASGVEAVALPAPLVALLVEEHRLAGEGRDLLAAEARSAVAADDATREEVDAPADARGPLVPRRRRVLRPGPIAALLAGVLLVAGLGTASASGLLTDDDGWRSQEPTSTPGPPSTPDPRIGMPVPAFTAEPPAAMHTDLTDVETVAALRESADGEWQRVVQERPDAVRPDVPVERILAGEQWVRQQAACLGESGVRVQVIGTGDDVRLGTDSADPVVRYVCQVRFPVAPQGPLTDAALGWLHDYYVDFLLPCYASEGEPYEGEAPDRDTFIALSRAGDPWQPHVETRDGVLESRCPQAPAGFR
ncbi:hypothetical protein ABID70_001572 [Clavibacter michiganensis]|uniref:hypothetical protein n=1 Tax=Clavibacter michiganensis TaxID=28447 RepID=UPI001AE9DA23|nr:hypothetical protein [Clavibacter michiganensis]MBP2459003.1 hypothetical protein [Clavibacter michiganensis]MDQ0411575.1 hypothetical protein [Clavibacter michiganensis]